MLHKLATYIKYHLMQIDMFEPAMEDSFREIANKCHSYTMTNIPRMYALYKAVEYIVRRKIPGDLVETGVWRGGSAMNMALSLQFFGDTTRKIYLYDTYEGMVEPGDQDVHSWFNSAAKLQWSKKQRRKKKAWCYAGLDEVQTNLEMTGYPQDQLVFVKGKVEQTIPATQPQQIALLRLDTDWYNSTLHELQHLFPCMTSGGVLIMDDYGHWQGQKQATDEYFSTNKINMLLNRIDCGARIGIKCMTEVPKS